VKLTKIYTKYFLVINRCTEEDIKTEFRNSFHFVAKLENEFQRSQSVLLVFLHNVYGRTAVKGSKKIVILVFNIQM
jgi:hypothetical protein